MVKGAFDGARLRLASVRGVLHGTTMWTAILLAGQRPGPDALAAAFGETAKALVRVDGEAMVSRVARTLLACADVGRIVVVAQAPAGLTARDDTAWLAHEPRIDFVVSGDGIASSVAALAGTVAPWPVLVTTADHVLLTPAIVAAFVRGVAGADIAVGMVEAATMRAAYPESRRTWLKFRGGQYSGANLFALANMRAVPALTLWAGVEQDRKKGWRLLWRLGPGLLIGAATRTLTLAGAIRRLGDRLGLVARVVVLDDAEAAIDVDKPSDHALATAILAARAATRRRPTMSSPVALAIYDMDRTITRRGTYTPWLLYWAWRMAPWRLLLVPATLATGALFLVRAISRGRLKELNHALLMGGAARRADVERIAAAFARRKVARGLLPGALAQLAADRAEGRRLVLATASYAFYAAAIAAELGIADVVATRSVWDGDRLRARIDGDNCYGAVKGAMVAAWLAALPGGSGPIRAYSDHVSDAPLFDLADEAVATTPSLGLRRLAARRRWKIVDWR